MLKELPQSIINELNNLYIIYEDNVALATTQTEIDNLTIQYEIDRNNILNKI